ncbi:hypothetical protein WUBG_09638 [Wuchereria bancrofti]|uniref:Uncharacterized protein n=1 Tax=Wuchereria bancrofti TaxID=6293 RepID=J9EQU9_WUCBA|nr:hypothetical protein WUBG_09638 [Wuchereria bancrofti]VDM08451.1 unnamed protein product [Wuchereria bancrofti]
MYCKYQGSELAEMDNSVKEIQLDENLDSSLRISSRKSIKKHDELLKSSGEILRKLNEVRQTKAYEMMKYETIARMNASSVTAYLRQQRLRPNQAPLSETEAILQKHHEEMKNHAATIIQQFFRRITRKKQIDRIFCTWKWISLPKRIQYIEAIAERMAGGTLVERKRTMYRNVDDYVRREQLIKHIANDLALLNGITNITDLMKTNSNNFSAQKTTITK